MLRRSHDHGQRLLWSIEPAIGLHGDRELLAQAVVNLLENAQRHTPAGTVIRLTLVRAGESVCIRVIDNGPGVPKADLHRVMKPLRATGNQPQHGWLWLGAQPRERSRQAALRMPRAGKCPSGTFSDDRASRGAR